MSGGVGAKNSGMGDMNVSLQGCQVARQSSPGICRPQDTDGIQAHLGPTPLFEDMDHPELTIVFFKKNGLDSSNEEDKAHEVVKFWTDHASIYFFMKKEPWYQLKHRVLNLFYTRSEDPLTGLT